MQSGTFYFKQNDKQEYLEFTAKHKFTNEHDINWTELVI